MSAQIPPLPKDQSTCEVPWTVQSTAIMRGHRETRSKPSASTQFRILDSFENNFWISKDAYYLRYGCPPHDGRRDGAAKLRARRPAIGPVAIGNQHATQETGRAGRQTSVPAKRTRPGPDRGG